MQRNIPLYFFSNLPIETANGRILDQHTCVQVNKTDEFPDRAIEWASENLKGFEAVGYDPMHKEVIWEFDLPETWEPCPALLVCERLRSGKEQLIERFRELDHGSDYTIKAHNKWLRMITNPKNKYREFLVRDNKLNMVQDVPNSFQVTTFEEMKVEADRVWVETYEIVEA